MRIDSNGAATPVNTPRQVLFASLIGTTIEFFDFYIYATAAVLVFPRLFFPASDPASATLASLATFAIAFLARPIGSALFGHFGDRIGRKTTLVAALLTMGISTVAIGVLPTYASIGVAAPLLLATCRFGQGLGLGGEWGGAVLLAIENAPPGKRAWYGMFPQLGAPVGFFFSGTVFLALSAWLTDEQFFSFRMADSLPCQRGARDHRPLRPPHHHGDSGLPGGPEPPRARQSPDVRGVPRASRHRPDRRARLARNLRPLLPDDRVRALVGHDRARVQPADVPVVSAVRCRVLRTDDSAGGSSRGARPPPHAHLGHDRDRRCSA